MNLESLMAERQNNFKYVLLWLLPTWTELIIYLFFVFFTALLCSQDFVNSLLFSSGDFNPIRAGIASIDGLLQHFLGEKLAGGLSLGIFWGIVGLAVNLLWWLGNNFSTELNNDLVFSKYVHPRDTDPNSQLRELIIRTLVRTVTAIIGLSYLNFTLSQGLPSITNRFADMFKNWSSASQWQELIFLIFYEVLLLHGFVVLTRLILLRKQVFSA